MPDALLSLTPEPLDATALVRLLDDASAPGEHGAVTAFVGMVRAENLGRRVIALDYEAYEPLALEAFRLIAEEAAAAWPGVRLAIRQRVGRVGVGDAS
nr:molybdenum cofactor biosynthesis protein MoaE [Vicinamibacterales bacterium]